MKWLSESTAPSTARWATFTVYGLLVLALIGRVAYLDDWTLARWVVLALLVATAGPDRVQNPTMRSLALGVGLFGALTWAIAYVPDLWFDIADRLNHRKTYLWIANDAMAALPFNDGAFLWRHQWEPFSSLVRWIYLNGFDMVVWIPLVRSLAACDTRKVARYALGAHVLQFPLIMPFYSAFRVDEVWTVLGDPDRCMRGWSDEVKHNLGANCFPSMHTSVAFAVWLMARGEKGRIFRVAMPIYCGSIIFSTLYMEIHWLVDVAGGLLLGAGSVLLADWLLTRRWWPRASAETAAAGT